MHDQTTTGQAGEPARISGTRPVAVLSACVLRAARTGYLESTERFAARAGIGLHVVEGVEDRTTPAWELPYASFTALSDAISVLNPSLRAVFETAVASDLVLTCVMSGDQAFSTDVLADDDTRDITVALLRWAITGDSGFVQSAGLTLSECGDEPSGRLLGGDQRALLRQRAAALARSSSPDAWVGAEILAVFGGDR